MWTSVEPGTNPRSLSHYGPYVLPMTQLLVLHQVCHRPPLLNHIVYSSLDSGLRVAHLVGMLVTPENHVVGIQRTVVQTAPVYPIVIDQL